MFEVFGVFVALAIFIILTIKRWNICFSVLLSILIITLTNSMDYFECLTLFFSKGLGDFAAQWWLLFVLGAVYGKVMQKSGNSKNIAFLFTRIFAQRSIFVILIISAFMSYGGIGTFIIAFAIYPIASEIFEKENISKNLLPATILFCPTTICMTMLPGTPSVQNIIPTKYLGTSIYAEPIMGITSAVICFILGYSYLAFQAKKGIVDKKSSHFGKEESSIRNGLLSLIPCIVLWVMSFWGIKLGLDSQSTVEIAILFGILLAIISGRLLNNQIDIKKEIEEGTKGGFQTVMITSCIMGYGAVVKNSNGFEICTNYFFNTSNNPIVMSIIIVNIIALITGSSAGSLSLFFENYQNILVQTGLNANQLHRIIAIASGGMDSMPYATGIVVTNDLAKVSIKDSYWHIFVTCAIFPLVSLLIVLTGLLVINGGW